MRPANRLRSSSDFSRVTEHGTQVRGEGFVLYHAGREAEDAAPRIGFAVGRRIGKAVTRNAVKRKLREAIRPLLPRLAATDIVVVARPEIGNRTVADIASALHDVAERAGLLRED